LSQKAKNIKQARQSSLAQKKTEGNQVGEKIQKTLAYLNKQAAFKIGFSGLATLHNYLQLVREKAIADKSQVLILDLRALKEFNHLHVFKAQHFDLQSFGSKA